MDQRTDTVEQPDLEAAPTAVAESRAQIEQTRGEMSGTISAIEEKLNPKALAEQARETGTEVADHAKEAAEDVVRHVKEAVSDLLKEARETLPEVASHVAHEAVSGVVNEAKDAVQKAVGTAKAAMGGAVDAAKGTSMTIIERIQQNPVPAALAGIGLYWLFQGGKNPVPAVTQAVSTAGSKIGTVVDQVQDKAGEIAGQVHDKAGEIAGQVHDKAGQIAGQVHDKAGQIGDSVQDQAHRGSDTYDRMLHENPLAVGAIALVLGAALGLAIPETAPEHRLMGQTRDKLVGKAQDAAQDLGHKVQSVASEALGTATDALGTVKDAVKAEAKNQGLAPQS